MKKDDKHIKHLFESEEYLSQFQPNEDEMKSFFTQMDAAQNQNPLASKFNSDEYLQQFTPHTQEWLLFEKYYLNKNFLLRNIYFDIISIVLLFSYSAYYLSQNIFTNTSNINTDSHLSYNHIHTPSHHPIHTHSPSAASISTSQSLTLHHDSNEKYHSSNHHHSTSHVSHSAYTPTQHSNNPLNNHIVNNRTNNNINLQKSLSTQSRKNTSISQLNMIHSNNLTKNTSHTSSSHSYTLNENIHNQSNLKENNKIENAPVSSTHIAIIEQSNIILNPRFITWNDSTLNLSRMKVFSYSDIAKNSHNHWIKLYSGFVWNKGYDKNINKNFSPFIELSYLNNYFNPHLIMEMGVQYSYIDNTNLCLITSIKENYDFGVNKDTSFLKYQTLHFLSIPLKLHYTFYKHSIYVGFMWQYLLYTNASVIQRHYNPMGYVKEESTKSNNYITGLNTMNYSLIIGYEYRITHQWSLGISYFNNFILPNKNGYLFNTSITKNKGIYLSIGYNIISK